MSTSFRMYTVDAFADKPFSGNPAGVCLLLDAKLEDSVLKKIAAEMRHSETAFISTHPEHSASNPIYGLRWFTPTVEVNLCGHATLAAAQVLFNEEKLVTGNTVLFETLSGVLKVERKETILELNFPRGFPMHASLDITVRESILEAFGLPFDSVVDFAFCVQTKKLILELSRPSLVWAARVPDAFELTSIHCDLDVRGISLACGSQTDGWKEEEGQFEALRRCDFVSRYFSPWNGIPEDPVNGSSHTVLPFYFSKKQGNKHEMKAYMASERGGYLWLRIDPSHSDRIFIAGNAYTVLSGSLRIN